MEIYEIQSLDEEDFANFYYQVCDQLWYVFNAKRVKEAPIEEQDEEENKKLQKIENTFLIHSEDGYDDIDVGYLFGLYAVLKYYSYELASWREIDEEINELVEKYRLLYQTN